MTTPDWMTAASADRGDRAGTLNRVFDFGITGYRPHWLHGHAAVIAAHGERLAALADLRLTHVWLVWDLEADGGR